MNVQSVGPSNTESSNQTARENTTVDYRTFMKLLVEQIKNQDPTNPISSTDMLAQLASFSGVEQQSLTNTKLDALTASVNLIQSASLIGMRATSLDGIVDGQIASVESVDGQYMATLNTGVMLSLSDELRISRNE